MALHVPSRQHLGSVRGWKQIWSIRVPECAYSRLDLLDMTHPLKEVLELPAPTLMLITPWPRMLMKTGYRRTTRVTPKKDTVAVETLVHDTASCRRVERAT
jgi:hypothetical protein